MHPILLIMLGYAAVGAAVAAWFLAARIERDASAHLAFAFRPLLVPGLILLWPLVLGRMSISPVRPHRDFRATHRRVWRVLAVLLPLLVLGSLAIRQNGPTEAPPVRLAPP